MWQLFTYHDRESNPWHYVDHVSKFCIKLFIEYISLTPSMTSADHYCLCTDSFCHCYRLYDIYELSLWSLWEVDMSTKTELTVCGLWFSCFIAVCFVYTLHMLRETRRTRNRTLHINYAVNGRYWHNFIDIVEIQLFLSPCVNIAPPEEH